MEIGLGHGLSRGWASAVAKRRPGLGRDMNRSKGKERWIHDYKSSQKILLVGEGDFSFSACLARAFHTAENIVATSYLKRKSLLRKHWTSIPHLEELESLGCLLLYKVDVYKMHTHPILKNKKFDIIIFNFPHAGHYDYLCERDPELIEMHMDLVEAYFKSASKLLTKGGEVHLRHREDPPYDSWNVVWLAAKASLTLKEKVDFEKSDYPGYHNKRGGGINTNKSFPIICASTFKFSPSLPKVVNHHYYGHCYDLSKKDEVHVLEMNNQVQVLCGKDMVYDHVNIKFQKDEVDDFLEKDEANDDLFVQTNYEIHLLKDGRADVYLPKNDIAVDVHVLEMVDVCEHGAKKNHKVDDDVHEQSIKNVENDDDIDVYVKEMKDEMEKVHDDLYARVLEMMDQLQGISFLGNGNFEYEDLKIELIRYHAMSVRKDTRE
ncbi:hypothetical protein L1987_55493 [Smallanthus sonchifolius]|uniref:Uncharacterized protein n=1 Tax=Smallanthus sonchifolius TaxID=185202 RepID=A0ACB9EA26_9ASTR|nr:hypothetical protein L1987_55493 [Smallanthus sonchifolius]